MNLVFFILVLISVTASGAQTFSAAQKYDLPSALSALIWSTFNIFAGSLLCGAISCYAPLPVSMSIIGFCGLSSIVIWKATGVLPNFPQLKFDLSPLKRGPWNIATVLISVVSLILLYPYAECFAKLILLLISPAAELGWDAVSYHLPALIEFIQAHSFWTFEGPYQSYSYGFELIYGLSILFCHSHWGVIVGHGLSILLLLLSTAFIVKQLLDTLEHCGVEKQNRLMVHLLVQAIWAGVIFRTSLDGVGNNDVFEAAMLLAAFGFFMDFSRRDREQSKPRLFLLALGTMSFILALATKAPALMFTPLFLIMSVCEKADNRPGFTLNIADTVKAIPLVSLVVVVGAFFLWHNIPKFGGICDPLLACGFRDTLLHHLRDSRLLIPTAGSVSFFSSGLSLFLFWFLWRIAVRSGRANTALPFIWIAVLYVSGAAAFSYTPFGVTPDYDANQLTRLFFQDRKAMVMYMATAFAIALSAGVLCARAAKSVSNANRWEVSFAPPVVASVVVGCLISVPVINWWWHRDWPVGLVGYETVKGLPHTNIYRWVQNFDSGKRIYSAGLRPYGLFGRNYDNRLFYDLHSHILKTERQSRLFAVLDQFHPEIILISVDPHAYTGGPQKPDLVDWMKRQPCFTSVYEDETVSGFRVNDGWRRVFQQYSLPAEPLRMHS